MTFSEEIDTKCWVKLQGQNEHHWIKKLRSAT